MKHTKMFLLFKSSCFINAKVLVTPTLSTISTCSMNERKVLLLHVCTRIGMETISKKRKKSRQHQPIVANKSFSSSILIIEKFECVLKMHAKVAKSTF